MKKDPKLLLIIIQGIIIGVLLVFLVLNTYDSDSELSRHAQAAQIDSLKKLVDEIKEKGNLPPSLDQQSIKYLKEKGLINPVEDLRNDLIKEGALIKRKGVLGGSMGFYLPEAIHVLNENWVMAYFEDGHIAGVLLLKFDVQNGEISWEVLDEIHY